jgi:colanic acid biosynthesis glycosyl transferase WcaI
MRVLIVTPHYLPDAGPSAPLYAMLCEALVKMGYDITIIAGVPHYPSGLVSKNFKGFHVRRTVECGVNVVRVPLPSVDRSNLWQRLLQLFVFQIQATWIGLRCNYDVAMFSSPALAMGIAFAVLTVFRRKPAIYSIHDVYPEVGVTLGVLRHQWIIKFIAMTECFCLKRAKYVRILSESFAPSLHKLGVPDHKMKLIYDWVDTDLIHPLPRDNAFAREYKLVEKFVVLYAGNIGLSQGLESVIEAAQSMKCDPSIQFVFVGDGSGKAKLVAEAEQQQLKNVTFLPFQPRSKLPEVLASADISLVILQKGIGSVSLPSKTLSILASGRPILASVDEQSDISNLVKRSEAGVCIPPEHSELLVSAIRLMQNSQDTRDKMSRAGRSYALKYHSPDMASNNFADLLMNCTLQV